MRNAVTPKLLFYGIMLIAILLAMVLEGCLPAPQEITFQVQGIRDDNTVILKNLNTGKASYLEVENPYSQAYEIGLLITLIK